MISKITSFLTKTPIYPHWLETFKIDTANELLLKNLSGNVLEVGAGDGARKNYLLSKYKKIDKYVATDYSSWDEEFKKIDEKVDKFGQSNILFDYKKRAKLDVVCDAKKLPFEDNTFDYHLSFEVLEHIDDPSEFFKEASRVLKKQGFVVIQVPFLYRMHGGEPLHKMDYFRYLNGSFYLFAEKFNMKVVQIYSNSGVGTTVASIINQWLIRVIFESTFLIKIPVLLLSPIIFTVMNCFGFLVDIKPDKRFATHFHIILQKN